MKKILLTLALTCLSISAFAGVRFGTDRPFNWYYHNSYQYYYPRHHYQPQSSCSWIYTNGAYVYYCN